MRAPGLRLSWALLFVCHLASPGAAHGQDLAAAEKLFNVGVADLEAGKFDAACPALAESQRLDPRPGTLFTLADCRDKQGQIATAIIHYDDYLHAVDQMTTALKLRHHDRAKIARARKGALSPEVPELTLTLPDGAPAEIKVTRDGVELTKAIIGVALPINPGEHVLTVQAGDGPVIEQRVTLAKREKKTIVLQLAPSPAATAAPAPTTSASASGARAPAPAATPDVRPSAPATTPSSTPISGRKIGALAAGGIGLAGIGLGAAMGILALDQKGIIDEHCPERRCDAVGTKARQDIQTPGLVSTIGFGVGAAGLAAATVLWLTAPSAKATEKKSVTGTLDVGPAGATFGVKGRF